MDRKQVMAADMWKRNRNPKRTTKRGGHDVTLRTKAIFTAVFLFAVTSLVSGCNTALAKPEPYVPEPVSEAGVTLDWGTHVKSQALAMIDGSQKICDLDIYELADPDILHALEAAHQRGVDVRVIVDSTESHSQKTAVPDLRKFGVKVVSLHISHGINHVKMLITDGDHGGVLIGGMNFGAGSWNNNDGSVYFEHPGAQFETLFHFDWQRAQGQPAAAPKLRLPLVTDRRIQSPVVQAIQSATTSVSMEAFDLSDRTVISALVAAAKRGVQVEVLLDPNQYMNEKSATTLRDAGVTFRFYRAYEHEWMHAKILDVDNGRIFIIGSANFSHQAYTYNHEADVVLQNVTEFDKSLQKDLSDEIARGTDYPLKTVKY
jgi:cardiolipin synthase A/B